MHRPGQGDPAVIARLKELYAIIMPTLEQAHRQEHQYESDGYRRVGDWFDKVEGEKKGQGHAVMLHPLMCRINALGDQADSPYAFPADPARPIEQLDAAVRAMLGRLMQVYDAYRAACEAADDADDYVTESMLHEHLCWLERVIGKFRDREAQIAELGVSGYLQEMFDKH